MIGNKKGFLLGEETIKIILAIVCIAGLIVFVVYIYNGYSGSKESENAKASLTRLVNNAKAGGTEETIYNPSKWILLSASSSDKPLIPGADVMPKQCTSAKWDHCLCLCNPPGGAIKSFLVACDNKGFCLQSDFSVQGGTITIDNPPVLLSLNQQTKTISRKQ